MFRPTIALLTTIALVSTGMYVIQVEWCELCTLPVFYTVAIVSTIIIAYMIEWAIKGDKNV